MKLGSKKSCVRCPGLSSHPTHAVAKRMTRGFDTIISFDLRGGHESEGAVWRSIRLIHHAKRLRSEETTMERRTAIPGQEYLPPSLVRLSVGIEDADDLWADLDAAMRSDAM